MGLLDDMMGAALGGNAANSPLGGLLGELAGGASGGNPLGDLLKQFGAGDATRTAGLMAAVMALVQQMGGFEGVMQKLQQAGLGNAVQSWLSNGPNLTLGAQQVQDVFGAGALQQVAQQAGMNATQAAGAIGQLLPELINQFSPQGTLSGNHAELLQQGLSMLLGSRR